MRALWITLAAVASAIAAIAGLAISPFADVDEVTIFGLHRVSLAEATEALGFGPGRPMVAINTGAAAEALEEIAWIATASVERQWPGTVDVIVTERAPVAVALAAPDRWVLVDSGARVLSEPIGAAEVAATELARISGIRAAGPPGSFLGNDAVAPLAALSGLTEGVPGVASAPLAPGEIYAVWRDEREGLMVDTTIGVRLVLGDDTQLRSKIVAVGAVLDHKRATAPDATGERATGEPATGEPDPQPDRQPDRQPAPQPTTLLDVSVPHLPVERALR